MSNYNHDNPHTYQINDLTGEQLDYAVALALGYRDYPHDPLEQGFYWHTGHGYDERLYKPDFKPTQNKAFALELLEEYEWDVLTRFNDGKLVWAIVGDGFVARSSNSLTTAIMLALVKHKLKLEEVITMPIQPGIASW